jgi:hypothetical protein
MHPSPKGAHAEEPCQQSCQLQHAIRCSFRLHTHRVLVCGLQVHIIHAWGDTHPVVPVTASTGVLQTLLSAAVSATALAYLPENVVDAWTPTYVSQSMHVMIMPRFDAPGFTSPDPSTQVGGPQDAWVSAWTSAMLCLITAQ